MGLGTEAPGRAGEGKEAPGWEVPGKAERG
mgnify:CR=1 FL=1